VNLDKRIKIRNLDVLTPTRKKFRLRWKEYQILSLLVDKSPELVSRTEIIENIWKGTYCSDSTINQTIKSIRQKIDDTGHTIIRTIPRLGYKVENRAAFHFISEEDELEGDEIWGNESVDNKNTQAEMSENNDNNESLNAEIDESPESDVAKKSAEKSTSAPEVKKGPEVSKVTMLRGFFSMPTTIAVKYLAVFLSLLVISHFSYVLGNQTRPPMINDIQNNTRVMLTLTLNNAQNDIPQTLLCRYEGGRMAQATIECVDPKQGKDTMKYETTAAAVHGRINLILPNKTVQYQVAYEVKN
jgi:DNA-binding winged helix-turn-helix (wHTH) protein